MQIKEMLEHEKARLQLAQQTFLEDQALTHKTDIIAQRIFNEEKKSF